ncbi:alpha/beta hydrolase-fold protein [Massilia sp. W12]|uniref:alpha/beta hydrolase-fold protein n=1 Tax=Massilia sp. W12 TaxID=3126507 RepID=UPI0030D3CF9B
MFQLLHTHAALNGSLLPAQFSLYAPTAQAVALVGEMTHWLSAPLPMQRGADGVWRISLHLRPGQWLYKFVCDGCLICDPACALSVADGLGGQQSCLLLGQGDWSEYAGCDYGAWQTLSCPSRHLPGASMELWRPAGAHGALPVLFLLHGYRMQSNQWRANGRIAQFAANLMRQAMLPPCMLALPCVVEHSRQAAWQAWFLQEAPAWLAECGAALSPGQSVLAGMAQYDVHALALALAAPGQFGQVLALSCFFSQNWLQQLAHDLPAWLAAHAPQGGLPFDLQLYCGAQDYVAPRNARLLEILQENGLQAPWRRFAGGHTWHDWMGATRAILLQAGQFFASRAGS